MTEYENGVAIMSPDLVMEAFVPDTKAYVLIMDNEARGHYFIKPEIINKAYAILNKEL